MKPKIKIEEIEEIAKEILESEYERIDLSEYCLSKTKSLLPKAPRIQLSERSDEMQEKLGKHSRKIINSYHKRGLPPPYDFGKYSPDILICYSRIKDESIPIAALRRQLKRVKEAIKEMDWHDFEHLCKHILQNTIGHNIYVNRGTKEGGVDIYGILELGTYIPGILFRNAKLRVLGQAKKWSNNVGPDTIDELRTKYNDLLQRSGQAYNILPEWFKSINESVISLVITSSTFTVEAKKSANIENLTMILIDSDEIVEMIIQSPNANQWLVQNEKGQFEFDKRKFINTFQNEH
ncbi:MAG: restriction endonuclease [bacterium]|nr:restriction endonuclease [bacterium]